MALSKRQSQDGLRGLPQSTSAGRLSPAHFDSLVGFARTVRRIVSAGSSLGGASSASRRSNRRVRFRLGMFVILRRTPVLGRALFGEFQRWLDRGGLPAGVRLFPRVAIPRAPVGQRKAIRRRNVSTSPCGSSAQAWWTQSNTRIWTAIRTILDCHFPFFRRPPVPFG